MFELFLISVKSMSSNIVEVGDITMSDNGIFMVNELHPETNLWLLFLTKKQRATFNDQTNNIIECDSAGKPIFQYKYIFSLNSAPTNFSIDTEGNYSVFACSCTLVDQDLKLDASIRNFWPENNSRPIIIISYCEIGVYFVLLILWTKNWCSHPTLRTLIHLLIYGNLIVYFVTSLMNSIFYSVYEDLLFTDTFVVNDIFNGVSNYYTLWICYTFALGLSSTKESLTLFQTLVSLCACLVYSVPQILIGSSFSNTFNMTVLIAMTALFLIGYFLYFALFMISLRKTVGILQAHLVSIAKTGIDPNTTPSYRKMKMLKILAVLGLAVFLFQAISTLLSATEVLAKWPAFLIIHLLNAILVSAICYLCRIRKAMDIDTYQKEMPDNENNQGAFDKEGTKWTTGIPLPPIPSKPANTTRIEAETEDGISPW